MKFTGSGGLERVSVSPEGTTFPVTWGFSPSQKGFLSHWGKDFRINCAEQISPPPPMANKSAKIVWTESQRFWLTTSITRAEVIYKDTGGWPQFRSGTFRSANRHRLTKRGPQLCLNLLTKLSFKLRGWKPQCPDASSTANKLRNLFPIKQSPSNSPSILHSQNVIREIPINTRAYGIEMELNLWIKFKFLGVP